MPSLKRHGEPAIHYEIDDYTDPWKQAPVLLLQHGFGRSHRVWYSWVPYLSRFYKVVRPDGDVGWAYASQSRSALTLQTCVSSGKMRLVVRFYEVSKP